MSNILINEQSRGLFIQFTRELIQSDVGKKATILFTLLILLFVGVNVLNVVNSYVGRDFMSAIEKRNTDVFVRQAMLYIGVFALSTVVAVFLRYCEERLGLLWRDFLTRRLMDMYLSYPTYHRINDELIRSSGITYPDQRIAEDVRAFTVTTLSFVLLLVNGLFTIIAFSGVLVAISGWLFAAAVAYAAVGSYCAIRLGKPLIDLNYTQLDKEAAFRSGLIHVREHAESIAVLHRENRIKPRVLRQFDEAVNNLRKIILLNRNLGFFTTGYNYLIQIIPILIVTPLFMQGKVEFGVITQSAMAFGMLVGAFSLIVNQFQSISSYAAVLQRLINFWYGLELAQSETVTGLDVREELNEIVFQNVTLRSPADGRILIQDLDLVIPEGKRTLVRGLNEAADGFFKATVGIFDTGSGRIRRPSLDKILFLPERPYLAPGTLRTALSPDGPEDEACEQRILDMLKLLGLEEVLVRAGGLDVEHDWDTTLSPTEQHLFSLTRILLARPHFAVLCNPFKDLSPEAVRHILEIVSAQNITYITVRYEGQRNGVESYDSLLDFRPDGTWSVSDLHSGQ